MLSRFLTLLLLFAVAHFAWAESGEAGTEPLPRPRPLRDNDGDDGDGFSLADFERMLLRLRAEREGLSSDWQALRKRNTAPEPNLEIEQRYLEKEIQRVLEGLRKGGPKSASPGLARPDAAKKKPDADASERKTDNADAVPETQRAKSAGGVDLLAQAHTLVRSKQYEEALAAFQQLDLKGMKVGERAPIQYLKACCLLHLGKYSEAAELLQEVANFRGDEKLAGYAQWQLEHLRWHRDLAARIQDIRQRHQALEKGR